MCICIMIRRLAMETRIMSLASVVRMAWSWVTVCRLIRSCERVMSMYTLGLDIIMAPSYLTVCRIDHRATSLYTCTWRWGCLSHHPLSGPTNICGEDMSTMSSKGSYFTRAIEGHISPRTVAPSGWRILILLL